MAPNDYDDDDYYDPDEDDFEAGEDELSPEDRASMTKGTAEVRKALGSDSSKVTVVQIEEALWHYYYDVEKSVAYLQKTFINPTPKPTPKKSAERKLSWSSCLAKHNSPQADANGADPTISDLWTTSTIPEWKSTMGATVCDRPVISMKAFFSDMPWLNTPQHRQTTFQAPPILCGGLLGGSSAPPKMSKLQALAAARKRKNEEKKDSDKTTQAESGLEKLSISETSLKKSVQTSQISATRQASDEPPTKKLASSSGSGTGRPTLGVGVESHIDAGSEATTEKPNSSSSIPTSSGQLASPSPFAQTLVGSAPGAKDEQRQAVFAMPYTLSSSFFASAFAEPSPDDVVFAAQAKAGKKIATITTPSKKQVKSEKNSGTNTPNSDLASSVSNIKISDGPAPKSKGLDVVKEYESSMTKRTTSFVVVGHVDAGKSTLMGRLLVELKYVDQRTVDKYRRQAEKSGKQSFALAWIMDQRSEERERGVTIDIATNYFETDKTKFTILDAPGHRDFVPNMIAGASQADFAILVIDANTGAYEKGLKGQTREHVLLLRSLGLQRVIVAVNKLDMVGWSQDRFDDISQEVTGFLTGLGFQSKNVDFIPISGLNGDNIVKKIEDPAAGWYSGHTLIEALEAYEPLTLQALKKPFRMAVSEIFRSLQQGTTTLGGRIDAGTIQIGDALVVQPSGESAYVKSIMIDRDTHDWAVAGQNVSIALTGIDPVHIRIGDILCPASNPIAIGDSFTMKAMAFEHLMPMPIDLHRGRLHVPGHIKSLAATLDKATGELVKKKPKVVQPGGVARILIKLEEKVPLEPGQRVVIRSGGETIAAGLLE